jgi:hypothetical protein
MNKSSFFKLDARDYLRGFLVAMLGTISTGLVTILESGQLPDVETLKGLGITGLCFGLSYLAKNLFTNSKDELAKPEPKLPS